MKRTCKYCVHKDEPPSSDLCFSCASAKCSEYVIVVEHRNFEPIRSCGTCKYEHKKISAEPCDTCDIHLSLSNWEVKDGNQ